MFSVNTDGLSDGAETRTSLESAPAVGDSAWLPFVLNAPINRLFRLGV